MADSNNGAPVLTALKRARIVGLVGKRRFTRNEYNKHGSDALALEFSRLTHDLESADMVEMLTVRLEEYEAIIRDCVSLTDIMRNGHSEEIWRQAKGLPIRNANGETG